MIDGQSLLSAEQVISALDEALGIEAGPRERVESLLSSLPALLDRPNVFCACSIFDQWEKSRPRLAETFWAGNFPGENPRQWLSQATVDSAIDLLGYFWPEARDRPRRPISLIFPRDFNEEDLRKAEFSTLYAKSGLVESIYTMWAASARRSFLLGIGRSDGDPFTDNDRALAMLVIRAIGPVVDLEVLRPREQIEGLGLSERQYDVLDLLLRGLSEKEIARKLHRSPNTVHTHVMQIYRSVGVSGRAELMASFVDEAIAAAARRQTNGGPTQT